MREPYKQFMFHFQFPNNSIDARNITEPEMKWAKNLYEVSGKWHKVAKACEGNYSSDYKTIKKMFEMWFPEELL